MATIQYRRNGYTGRFYIPLPIARRLSRRECWRSLRTANYREALAVAKVMEGKLAPFWTLLERHLTMLDTPTLTRLVQEYLNALTDRLEEERASYSSRWLEETPEDEESPYELGLGVALERGHEALATNQYAEVADVARSLLQKKKIDVSEDSPAFLRLCRELLKAQLCAIRAMQERERNPEITSLRLGQSNGDGASAAIPESSGHFGGEATLRSILPEYLEHYRERNPRTTEAVKYVVRQAVDVLEDKPLAAITKRDVISLRDALAKTRKRTTVNSLLGHLSHIFQWAERHDYAKGNPVKGLQFEGAKAESYAPFTREDLTALFSPAFAAFRHSRPERYWLPLLLLYTAARREEIAQLRVSDVKEADNIVYFDINDEGEKSVKNATSVRRVPVHSHLIELGFMGYFDGRRARSAASSLVFPKSKSTRGKGRDTVGDSVSKWFERYRGAVKVKGEKPLHSFRHTAITALQAQGVPQEQASWLAGHSSPTMTGQVYTHREQIPLSLLKAAIEKLDFRACLSGLPKYR